MGFRRALVLAVLTAGLLFAGAPPVSAESLEPAKDFVDHLAHRALDVMATKGVSDSERLAHFHQLFATNVDMPGLARFVLGRHWRGATPAQQQEFTTLFENMLVLTWSSRFKDVGGNVTFQTIGTRPDVEQGVLVESKILSEKMDPVPIDWRLRQPDSNWRIMDLVIGGTSMAITYREEYASVIGQNGGKVDGLLTALRTKVAQLSGQAAAAGH